MEVIVEGMDFVAILCSECVFEDVGVEKVHAHGILCNKFSWKL